MQPGQFRKLARVVAERGGLEIADGRPGRQWRLDLADRVLLVATTYWRTNLTMRQIGPLLGVSHSAAHRVIDSIGPLLALAPVRRRRMDQVAIVDGTLIPTRDHRLAAPSKTTGTRQPAGSHRRRHPPRDRHRGPAAGNRNDCTAYRDSGIADTLAGRPVMADGGYQGNPTVIMPYRKRRHGQPLPDWQEDLNAGHRKVRARIEHTLARMKVFKILRDYRRAASTLADTASAIANLHNIILTG